LEQRSHERVYVDRSVGNMRDTVRAFARALTTMVSESGPTRRSTPPSERGEHSVMTADQVNGAAAAL
jgi:hypothetical protein